MRTSGTEQTGGYFLFGPTAMNSCETQGHPAVIISEQSRR